MNDALNCLDIYVRPSQPTNPASSWNVVDGKALLRYKNGLVSPALLKPIWSCRLCAMSCTWHQFMKITCIYMQLVYIGQVTTTRCSIASDSFQSRHLLLAVTAACTVRGEANVA